MALTDFQRELLAVLAKGRNPNSHFAGGATLNRNNPRLSDDFAIFADDAAILIQSVSDDLNPHTPDSALISGICVAIQLL